LTGIPIILFYAFRTMCLFHITLNYCYFQFNSSAANWDSNCFSCWKSKRLYVRI